MMLATVSRTALSSQPQNTSMIFSHHGPWLVTIILMQKYMGPTYELAKFRVQEHSWEGEELFKLSFHYFTLTQTPKKETCWSPKANREWKLDVLHKKVLVSFPQGQSTVLLGFHLWVTVAPKTGSVCQVIWICHISFESILVLSVMWLTDWLTDWLTEYWLHDLLMSGVVLIFETYRGSCRKRKSANESNEEVAQQKKIVIDKVYIDNDDRLDMPGLPDCFWTPFVRPCQTGETLSLGIHGNLCGDCRLGLAEMCHTGSLLCIVDLSDRRNTGMCHTGVIFVGLDQRNTGVFSGFVCHTGSRNTGMTSSQWSLGNMDGAKHREKGGLLQEPALASACACVTCWFHMVALSCLHIVVRPWCICVLAFAWKVYGTLLWQCGLTACARSW